MSPLTGSCNAIFLLCRMPESSDPLGALRLSDALKITRSRTSKMIGMATAKGAMSRDAGDRGRQAVAATVVWHNKTPRPPSASIQIQREVLRIRRRSGSETLGLRAAARLASKDGEIVESPLSKALIELIALCPTSPVRCNLHNTWWTQSWQLLNPLTQ